MNTQQNTDRDSVESTALFALGQHLFTRDGRIVGNAVVTEVTPEGLIRMETDFGNGGSLLNAKEVAEWWHTTDAYGAVRISDVSRWRADRKKCQENASVSDPHPPDETSGADYWKA